MTTTMTTLPQAVCEAFRHRPATEGEVALAGFSRLGASKLLRSCWC